MSRELFAIHDGYSYPNSKPIEYYINEKECHICVSHRLSDRGYPVCGRNIRGKRYYLISRYLWVLKNGDIEANQHVLHKCDNPNCINVNHLFIGSNKDNVKDKMSKSRQARHTDLSDKQIYEIKMNTGDSSICLAKKFRVSDSTIRGIWNEVTHRYINVENYEKIKSMREKRVKNRRRQFSKEQIDLICHSNLTNKELSEILSCSETTITRVRTKARKEESYGL